MDCNLKEYGLSEMYSYKATGYIVRIVAHRDGKYVAV